MGCCGRQVDPVAIPQGAAQDGNSVLVQYRGPRAGVFHVRGKKTGRYYPFNQGSASKQWVDDEDAKYILALPDFGAVEEA